MATARIARYEPPQRPADHLLGRLVFLTRCFHIRWGATRPVCYLYGLN